jgi:hypothetical protein
MSKKLFPITIAMAIAAMFVIPGALAGNHGTQNPPPTNPPCDSNEHGGTKPPKKCSTSSTTTTTGTTSTTTSVTTTTTTVTTTTGGPAPKFCNNQLGPLPIFFEVEGEPDPNDPRDPPGGDSGALVHACVRVGPQDATAPVVPSPTDQNCPDDTAIIPNTLAIQTDQASFLTVCAEL